MQNPRFGRRALVLSTAVVVALSGSTALRAQSNNDSAISVTSSDLAAASGATNLHHHIRFANTEAGRSAARSQAGEKLAAGAKPGGAALAVASNVVGYFPADLVYVGGPVVTSAESHAIYVNSNHNTGDCEGVSECWGNPEGFLRDLGQSTFIHVTDQYTGLTSNNRYTVGPHSRVSVPSGTLFDADLAAIVHSVAKKRGTGYSHIYHIFIPPGTDTCSTFGVPNGNFCYSPDNPATFSFCAYHGSVDFSDIGHVLFTVEPSQKVPGCDVAMPSPNGQLIDSTDSTLSHETFETITDPDGSAWFNLTSLLLAGAEIGDECISLADNTGASPEPIFSINGHPYRVQIEYSNTYHACINVP
jgi:hypothetical protein